MKKRTFTIALLILVLTGMLLIESVKGGIIYLPSVSQITINSDGTITPETTQVTRNGAIYTLTEDLNGTQIVIERKNIIFDGANHTINLMNSGANPAIHISYSTNTTIKNVELVTALYTGIFMYECSGCRVTGVKSSGYIELRQSSNNVFSENICPIFIKSTNNQVYRNNITGLALWAGSNVFYANNFLLESTYTPYAGEVNVWDNGYVGNYWSDYSSRYPNASEVDQTGIGDAPYVLDTDNVDRYPAMYPIYLENGTVAVPKPQPTSTPTPAASTTPTADATAIYAVGIFVVLITAVIAVSLLYRHKQRKTLAATFALAVLACSVAGLLLVAPAEAVFVRDPPAPHIIIAADGSVNSTQGVKQDGNYYYLTEDIQGYSFVVDHSNIILDGKGHLLNCTGYISHAILLQGVTNVTVKNFQIQGGASAVALMYGSTHCTIENITSNNDIYFSESDFNTVTKCNAGINLWLASNNNVITKNNITNVCNAGNSNAWFSAGSFNYFYLNNIMLDSYPTISVETFWDNGTIGNYWGNYSTRYPNASEIGYTGIGNTPYVVPRSDYTTKTYPNVTNTDHYPLMYPYDIENDQIALPERLPPTKTEATPSSVPVASIVIAAIVGAAITGLLYRQKRQKKH